MWTSTLIARQIGRLGVDQIFTTRDMLTYGRRAAVDKALSRMVSNGQIIRLARGVFMRDRPGRREVSVAEIAKVKAASFGRLIMTHAHDCAIRMGLLPETNENTMFNITGHSSSFRYGGVQIHFHGVSGRKFFLGDSQHGMLMRAFWYMDRKGYPSPNYFSAISMLNRIERSQMQSKARWIPSWLSDLICHEPSRDLLLPLVAPS